MKREYPESPIVGVGGVIFDGASVLLAKRGHEPAKGTWSLPGGAVELGEKVIDGLKREIREEIGIEIQVGGLIRVLDRIIRDEERRIRYHYVIVDYWGWKISGEPKPGSDTSDICFVPLEEIQKKEIHREVQETILMAAKLREGAKSRGL
ncbi:MAG TPA: NUDIX domain-containing protein [Desulfatiglandales bacterium]